MDAQQLKETMLKLLDKGVHEGARIVLSTPQIYPEGGERGRIKPTTALIEMQIQEYLEEVRKEVEHMSLNSIVIEKAKSTTKEGKWFSFEVEGIYVIKGKLYLIPKNKKYQYLKLPIETCIITKFI